MSEHVWLYFNGWGILFLAIFAGGYSFAHLLWFRNLRSAELAAKLVGFVGLIALFIVSGWKGGLVGLAIGFGVSCVALLLFKALFGAPPPAA